jgi:hypothetical protein
MAPEEHTGEGTAEGEPSVFGNLPKTRPGARSPRRDAGKAKARPVRAAGEAKSRRAPSSAKAKPSAPPPPPRRERPAPEQPDEAASSAGGGLEDIAWAGVAAAAEAATIGVRLANRALGAMRGAVDRR